MSFLTYVLQFGAKNLFSINKYPYKPKMNLIDEPAPLKLFLYGSIIQKLCGIY